MKATDMDLTTGNSTMLEAKQINAYYDKSHILFDVNVEVNEGETVTILGRNGNGKSTLLKTIIGEVRPHGSIIFKGKDIAGLKSYEIARLGIGYVPESRDIFPDLTVNQNLLMGLQSKKKNPRITIDDAYEIFPILHERKDIQAGYLSGGEKQLLTICRTLVGDPDLILVDEPTEGLAPMMISLLSKIFSLIKDKGISILLVEQKLALALEISHRIYVMSRGTIVYGGSLEEFKADVSIRKQYLEI